MGACITRALRIATSVSLSLAQVGNWGEATPALPPAIEKREKAIFPALLFSASAKLIESQFPAAHHNKSSRWKETAKAGDIQLKVSNILPFSTEQAERKIRFELKSGIQRAEQHAIKLHKLFRCLACNMRNEC